MAQATDRMLIALGLLLVGLGGERLLNAWLRHSPSSGVPFVIGVACAVAGGALILMACAGLSRRR